MTPRTRHLSQAQTGMVEPPDFGPAICQECDVELEDCKGHEVAE